MKQVWFVLLAAAVLAACSQPSNPTPVPSAPGANQAQPLDPAGPLPPDQLDVGDVEQLVTLEVSIAPADRLPGIQVDETENARKTVTMTSVKLVPPAPPQLWVTVALKTSESFIAQPVAGRLKVYADDRLISTTGLVLGKDANRKLAEDGSPLPPRGVRVNVFEGLVQPPSSMLVRAELEVLLTDPGTDEAAIDPLTYSVPADRQSVILSNPLRISAEFGFAPQ